MDMHWQLARHFSLEFSLGIGYLTTEYKNILLMREILYGQIVGVITLLVLPRRKFLWYG